MGEVNFKRGFDIWFEEKYIYIYISIRLWRKEKVQFFREGSRNSLNDVSQQDSRKTNLDNERDNSGPSVRVYIAVADKKRLLR